MTESPILGLIKFSNQSLSLTNLTHSWPTLILPLVHLFLTVVALNCPQSKVFLHPTYLFNFLIDHINILLNFMLTLTSTRSSFLWSRPSVPLISSLTRSYMFMNFTPTVISLVRIQRVYTNYLTKLYTKDIEGHSIYMHINTQIYFII